MMAQRNQSSTRKAALALYVGATLTLGAVLILLGWTRPEHALSALPLGAVAFWLFLSLASECFWLETPTGHGMISMSFALNMAVLFVLPAHLAVTIGFLSVGISDLLLHRRPVLKAIFNASQTALAMAGALAAMRLLGSHGPAAGVGFLLGEPLAVLAAPVVFFVLNTGIVAGVIAIDRSARFWSTWRENFGFGYQILSSLTLFAVGIVLIAAVESIGYVSGLLCLLFFLFVRDAYQRFTAERRRTAASGLPVPTD